MRGNKRKGALALTLIAAGLALLFLSSWNTGFANWYSVHIYPLWVGSVGRAAGLVPFSLSEILLYVLAGSVAVTGVLAVMRTVRERSRGEKSGPGREAIVCWLLNVFLAAGVLFFLYVLNCGINYHRESFADSEGITAAQYSAKELQEVCLWLTDEVNALSGEVARDESGVMKVRDGDPQEEAATGAAQAAEKETATGAADKADADSAGSAEVRAGAVQAMQELGGTYEGLAGYYPMPKGLIFPQILSVQDLTGIYSPFLVEANYNTAMTDYNIPFTMCHELSHLRGFMQEQEANFIAFLACRASQDQRFCYSGNLSGWVYCMNVLHEADYEAWEEVRARLAPEAEADLQANSEFWARYDGTVAEVANQVNDTYLKANGQQDGVKSYDRMVDLIVAYYMQKLPGSTGGNLYQ